MKFEKYFYNSADKIIESDIKHQVFNVIAGLDFKITRGSGEELRKEIRKKLKIEGWSDKFRLDAHSNISITSAKNDIVLCFQTGNMGRFYADLLKLEYVFRRNSAKAAFYLIPTKSAAKEIGSNIANFERFTFEINLFKDIITIPILIIGIT